jgi:hypothetical protein
MILAMESPQPSSDSSLRTGLLVGLAFSLGPQILASLGVVFFSRKGSGSGDSLVVMLEAILFGGAAGVLVLLSSVFRPKGSRGAFAGGAAMGLGLALLLAFPLCLGTISGVRP